MKYSAVLTVLLLSACLAGCAPEKEAAPPAAQEAALSESAPPVIPADSAALSRQALDVYGKGNGAEALRLAEKALAASPDNYEALALKGLLTAFAGAPEDGAAMIGKALEIYNRSGISKKSSKRTRGMRGPCTASPRIIPTCGTGRRLSAGCGKRRPLNRRCGERRRSRIISSGSTETRSLKRSFIHEKRRREPSLFYFLYVLFGFLGNQPFRTRSSC